MGGSWKVWRGKRAKGEERKWLAINSLQHHHTLTSLTPFPLPSLSCSSFICLPYIHCHSHYYLLIFLLSPCFLSFLSHLHFFSFYLYISLSFHSPLPYRITHHSAFFTLPEPVFHPCSYSFVLLNNLSRCFCMPFTSLPFRFSISLLHQSSFPICLAFIGLTRLHKFSSS